MLTIDNGFSAQYRGAQSNARREGQTVLPKWRAAQSLR
jgi:hypothetical protein